MTKRGVKCKAGDTWTHSRYFQFIRTALRGAFSRYPVKYQALKDAKRQDRPAQYECAICHELFKAKEVQVDHIVPAGSLKDYADLPAFVERLLCEKDGLQVVCKPCHKTKTAEDRKK